MEAGSPLAGYHRDAESDDGTWTRVGSNGGDKQLLDSRRRCEKSKIIQGLGLKIWVNGIAVS